MSPVAFYEVLRLINELAMTSLAPVSLPYSNLQMSPLCMHLCSSTWTSTRFGLEHPHRLLLSSMVDFETSDPRQRSLDGWSEGLCWKYEYVPRHISYYKVVSRKSLCVNMYTSLNQRSFSSVLYDLAMST